MKEIIRLENISYTYGGIKPALDDVSLSIKTGERIVVLGNNGAGKSTFFLCCNGVLRPAQGEVYLWGQKVGKAAAELFKLRRNVGLVFQDPEAQLVAGTVEAEISFGPMNLKLSLPEVKERVEYAIDALNLEALRQRSPHTLSGGEKKRVTLADILAMEPSLLMLDEPTSSLDQQNTALLEDYLAKLHDTGMALMIATHNVDFAWRWADRALVFSQGVLRADATPEQVFADATLMQQAGLARPILYEVGERLGLTPLPKTVSQLDDFRKNT